MATKNKVATRATIPKSRRTHEGAPAKRIAPELQLRRAVLGCLLWEDSFYEDGVEIAERIHKLAAELPPYTVGNLAIEARKLYHLRHAPLWLILSLLGRPEASIRKQLPEIIRRADEVTEILAMYWAKGRKPIPAQLKRGLADCIKKFDAYQLGKYKQETKAVKLRDVIKLTHPKPPTEEYSRWWKDLIAGTLEAPDTWEVALSAGKGKKETFERLMKTGKLGALAMLRNLRNMLEAKVELGLMRDYLLKVDVSQVFPYRFIAAAKFAPMLEQELEAAMFKSIAESGQRMDGETIVLVDVSGSMAAPISSRSDLDRRDAGAGVAMIVRELCQHARVFVFSDYMAEIPARRGFALKDAIRRKLPPGGTYLGKAVGEINARYPYERLIVITDEQSHDEVPGPKGRGYMINVAAYRNGVGYGKWTHVDGWSEAVVRYIMEIERAQL